MNIVSFIVVFVISWWILFFMALPIGNRIPEQQEKGHANSAPENPHLKIKVIVTTIVALLLTYGILYVINNGYLEFLLQSE